VGMRRHPCIAGLRPAPAVWAAPVSHETHPSAPCFVWQGPRGRVCGTVPGGTWAGGGHSRWGRVTCVWSPPPPQSRAERGAVRREVSKEGRRRLSGLPLRTAVIGSPIELELSWISLFARAGKHTSDSMWAPGRGRQTPPTDTLAEVAVLTPSLLRARPPPPPPPTMQSTSASSPLNGAPPLHAILKGECDEGERYR